MHGAAPAAASGETLVPGEKEMMFNRRNSRERHQQRVSVQHETLKHTAKERASLLQKQSVK